jgi:hypothetical protein
LTPFLKLDERHRGEFVLVLEMNLHIMTVTNIDEVTREREQHCASLGF